MAGPYYVDPVNGSDAYDGLSEGAPWRLIPGQTGANAAAGGTVGNPTIINVKNGTDASAGGRIIPTANNFTYRGYGLASNVLEFTQPVLGQFEAIYTKRFVREPGVHEGMWTLIGTGTETGMVSIGTVRSNITIEDINVQQPLDSFTGTCIYGSTSSSTATNFTVRRSRLYGGAYGYDGSVLGVTLDCVLAESQSEEGLIFGVDPTNGAGTTNTLLNICVRDSGRRSLAAGGSGDAIQFNSSGTGTKLYLAKVVIDGLYVEYSSDAKQLMKIYDATGGFTIQNFHFTGVSGANALLWSCLRGKITLKNGYIYQAAIKNPAIRVTSDDAAVAAMSTAATISVTNVIYEAPNGSNGLIVVGNSGLTTTVDGTILMANNSIVVGPGTPTVSTTAAVFSAVGGASTTIGANFSLITRNNIVLGEGLEIPAVKLPTGAAGQARFAVQNNSFTPVAEYEIGASTYSTLVLFEAANSSATENIVNDTATALLDAELRPFPASPMISKGIHTTYKRDIAGVQRRNPPSIGAYDLPTHRRVLDSDPATW